MYLFSRSTMAALGKQLEAIPAAIAMAERVSGIIDNEVNVFTTRFGAPLGTVTWSMRVDSFAEVQANNEKLLADAGYIAAADAMTGLFATPAQDALVQFVTAPFDAATSKFYGITRAAMADGQFGPAIDFGVKITEYIAKTQGGQSAFMKASYGGFGDVAWIQGFDTAADVDAFDEFQTTDAGFQGMVTEAAGLFVPNSGLVSLVEKLT